MVQGEYGTTVLLTLRSRDTGLRYEVLLRRHLKKELVSNPELSPRISPLGPRKAQRAGRPTSEAAPAPSADGSKQRTPISLVRAAVHSIRKLVLTLHQGLPPGQEEQDPVLTPTSIGITFTSPTTVWPSSAIKRITGLTQGGPAFLSGSLQEGDLLVAVEEVNLSSLPPSSDVAEIIRANGRIGSYVTLRIQSVTCSSTGHQLRGLRALRPSSTLFPLSLLTLLPLISQPPVRRSMKVRYKRC